MLFTTEDRILIKHNRRDKNMVEENMHELPNKPWSETGLDKLVKMIDDTGGTDRHNGSSRP